MFTKKKRAEGESDLISEREENDQSQGKRAGEDKMWKLNSVADLDGIAELV